MTSQFDAAIDSPTAPLLHTSRDGVARSFQYAIARLLDPPPWPFSRATTQKSLRLTLSESGG